MKVFEIIIYLKMQGIELKFRAREIKEQLQIQTQSKKKLLVVNERLKLEKALKTFLVQRFFGIRIKLV